MEDINVNDTSMDRGDENVADLEEVDGKTTTDIIEVIIKQSEQCMMNIKKRMIIMADMPILISSSDLIRHIRIRIIQIIAVVTPRIGQIDSDDLRVIIGGLVVVDIDRDRHFDEE